MLGGGLGTGFSGGIGVKDGAGVGLGDGFGLGLGTTPGTPPRLCTTWMDPLMFG